MYRLPFALSLALCSALAAQAHEFWIEPRDYLIEADEEIVAELKVGEGFEGASYAYFPNRFHRFDIVAGDETVAVEGRIGDRPALSQEPAGPGLNVVVHVTTDTTLTYDDWETFLSFLEHKDALWVRDAHLRRGLPQEEVTETYSRYAKSLIAAGSAEGSDRAFGLEVEIVALENPLLGASEIPARVLYRGEPQADAQLEVFEKSPAGEVEITRLRTDEEGVAVVPIKAGHEYLLDHVVLREHAPGGTMWESLWASLTFMAPG